MRDEVELDDRLTPRWFRHAVVADDGSRASQAGLTSSLRLARLAGARVTVVHVRHTSPWAVLAAYQGAVANDLLHTLQALEDEARSRAAKAFAGSGVRWDFQVRRGWPGREILQAAEEVDADLIVIGSNQHSTLHNLLVGSTTAYVTAHARVPVVVVRPAEAGRTRRSAARRHDREGRPALTVLHT